MTHHGDSGAQYALYRLADFSSSFHFDGFGVAFLHDADSRGEGFLGVALIGAERHVAYHQRAAHALDYALGVVYHLVEGYGQGGDIARHDVRGGVAYQYYVHAGFVDEFGHGVVVSCEHGDFFASRFHLCEAHGGYLALVVYSIG